jgi:hypothetical protein
MSHLDKAFVKVERIRISTNIATVKDFSRRYGQLLCHSDAHAKIFRVTRLSDLCKFLRTLASPSFSFGQGVNPILYFRKSRKTTFSKLKMSDSYNDMHERWSPPNQSQLRRGSGAILSNCVRTIIAEFLFG